MKMIFCRDKRSLKRETFSIFLFFLIGTGIGALLCYWVLKEYGLGIAFQSSGEREGTLANFLLEAGNGLRPLLCLFFLAFTPFYAAMVPVLFLLEGLIFGAGASALHFGLHSQRIWISLADYGLRRMLLLPVFFILGTWCMNRQRTRDSLEASGNPIAILAFLVVCAVAATGIEYTMSQHLWLFLVEGWSN